MQLQFRLLVLVITLLCVSTLHAKAPSFWSWWGDGKAEISVYDVQQSRYGEMRSAEQVFVYVTEPMNIPKQVKSDNGKGEVVNVLKLNRMKQFNTGIYQYNTMTSTFALLDNVRHSKWQARKGDFAKVTMTMQEWCGTAFEQMNRQTNGYTVQENSYFESEGDRNTLLTIPPSSPLVPADGLFTLARELVQPIEHAKLTLVRSAEYTRMLHIAPDVFEVSVVRSEDVPDWYDSHSQEECTSISFVGKEMTYEFVIEKQYPHKISAYRVLRGKSLMEEGYLRTSMREPYWSQNSNANEFLRKKLGLDGNKK